MTYATAADFDRFGIRPEALPASIKPRRTRTRRSAPPPGEPTATSARGSASHLRVGRRPSPGSLRHRCLRTRREPGRVQPRGRPQHGARDPQGGRGQVVRAGLPRPRHAGGDLRDAAAHLVDLPSEEQPEAGLVMSVTGPFGELGRTIESLQRVAAGKTVQSFARRCARGPWSWPRRAGTPGSLRGGFPGARPRAGLGEPRPHRSPPCRPPGGGAAAWFRTDRPGPGTGRPALRGHAPVRQNDPRRRV